MSTTKSFQTAGVDGCKAGWCVAIVRAVSKRGGAAADYVLELRSFFVASTFGRVLAETEDCALVCLDIPIGLCEGEGARECDTAARRLLGGRRASSVFPAPVRQALLANDRETASKINFKCSGKKLSCQSFNILEKIRQVDNLIKPELQRQIREIHPEISFWALNNKRPMQHKKSRLSGRNQRMQLLSHTFPGLEEIVALARKPREMAPDDILDAFVAVWTAAQTICGKTITLPENPACDSTGLRMEILCPAL
jgi:predicted RNase H-like nuclease